MTFQNAEDIGERMAEVEFSENISIEDDVDNESLIEWILRIYNDKNILSGEKTLTTDMLHPIGKNCANCYEHEAFYVFVTSNGTPFEFCKICRDELARKINSLVTFPERFGV